MEERSISPEESLEIIQKMIDNSRMKMAENGFHLIIWSVSMSIASIIQYFMIIYRFHLDKSWYMWLMFVLIALIIGKVYEVRRFQKEQIEKNKLNKLIDYLWLSFGISSALLLTLSWKYSIYDITPFILVSLGASTFISGIALQAKSLIIGGIVFWVSCILCIFIDAPEDLLINAVAMIIGFFIPGIQLWRNYKKEKNV